MRATSVVLLGLFLVPTAARAQSTGSDAGDAQAAGSDPAAALLAECANGEENDRCSLLEAVVTNNLLDDLETLYWAADQRSVPVALDALKIDDPRIQLAALRVLQQFAGADGVGTAVQPLLFASTMVVPSAAAVVLDWGASGLPAYLGGLYRSGHSDQAWTDEDNLFTIAPVPDPNSAGYTLADGLTPYPPADFFADNFTSAGFTSPASVDTVTAFYSAALGIAPTDFLSWAMGFYTVCGSSSTTAACTFGPLLGQFSSALGDTASKVVGVLGADKLVMVHNDPFIGKTVVRLAWRAPTALPQPIPTLPDDQVGPSRNDGGVAPDASTKADAAQPKPSVDAAQPRPAVDAPQLGLSVDAPQPPPGAPTGSPPATNSKSSGCEVTGTSGGDAWLPIFASLGLVLWLAARRTRKSR